MSEGLFHVGEIAIAVAPAYAERNLDVNGQEVEVLSEYSMQYTKAGDYMGYLVQCSSGVYSCRPEYLRKRPPKQDWLSLCAIRETEHV